MKTVINFFFFNQFNNIEGMSQHFRLETQKNNSGLVSKMYMERQAKSRKKPCLGNKDNQIVTHIKQKLTIGFLPN